MLNKKDIDKLIDITELVNILDDKICSTGCDSEKIIDIYNSYHKIIRLISDDLNKELEQIIYIKKLNDDKEKNKNYDDIPF